MMFSRDETNIGTWYSSKVFLTNTPVIRLSLTLKGDRIYIFKKFLLISDEIFEIPQFCQYLDTKIDIIVFTGTILFSRNATNLRHL